MKQLIDVAGGRFKVELHSFGRGEPLLYLHGALGFSSFEFLERLGRDFRVIAPHLPGYGESTGQELIDDVIDAALFYHALMDELGIADAFVLGHSMGGMLAAEMAALDTHRARKLVLSAPAGFWLDAHPIPDLFAAQLDELPELLFHDPKGALAQALTNLPDDVTLLGELYLERTKRLSAASKFLWPLPDRGLGKRIYRVSAPTLLIWGESDRVIPPAYAREFSSRLKNSRERIIRGAGHMTMYEQPDEFCRAVTGFFRE